MEFRWWTSNVKFIHHDVWETNKIMRHSLSHFRDHWDCDCEREPGFSALLCECGDFCNLLCNHIKYMYMDSERMNVK